MSSGWRGRTALVTGAASGIGAATAAALRERGARVMTLDLTDDVDHRVDVTDPEAVRAAFDAVDDELHAVVHCAGILATGTFDELDVARQLALVQVNLGGTIAVAHAAIPHLRRTRGSLVLMGSASGFHGPPEYATYGATKAAIISLAQSLRIELEDAGVHVTTCNPLFTATPMMDEPSAGASLAKRGAVHSAEDVAAAILRGVDRRSPMVLPGLQPKAIHLASRWLGGLGHPLMRRTWRRSRRTGATPPATNRG